VAVGWIRQHAVPFATEAPPAAGESDPFPALDQVAAAAQVVALGEATHGTHQFFQMKHRLIADLVGRQGFRTFAMEADGAGSCAIDDYLHTGVGDPAQQIRDLKFWTWSTEEFLDLVRWMRLYNQTASPGRDLSFRGIDMQNPLALSRKVVSFLSQVDPRAGRQADAAYRCLGPLEDHDALEKGYLQRDIVEQMRCAKAIGDIYESLSKSRARYERSLQPGYECAVWNAHLMVQAEMLLKFPSTRDHLYAENILALSSGQERVVVWAHNGHIGNIFGAMGRRLKRQLGLRYLTVGFTSYGGSFRARTRRSDGGAGPPVPIVPPPPAPDSYEAAFHRAGQPRFLLDLRPLRDGSGPEWLAGPHPLRDVGGAYDPNLSSSPSRLPEEFDSILFFDQSLPSNPLPKIAGPPPS
jgi:erythromycin esterase